jgi:two-component system sensor histidine kinase KdpD
MRDVDVVRTRDRLRAALLSSVSHDLRTPLTAVIAAANELDHGTTPELVATIKGEAARLNRFVANLLDMARVEAGALRLRLEPTDLTDAVAGAVHDTKRVLEGHAIELDVAPNLPLVRVDPQLLHHCLLNLLDNAGRYADPGTPVTVRGVHRHDTLTLSVLDQGPGLPPGRESEVFETFRRLRGSDRQIGGTGLGLAIVKKIVEEHLGQIGFSDRPGGGTLVTIILDPAALAQLETVDVAGDDGDAAARRAAHVGARWTSISTCRTCRPSRARSRATSRSSRRCTTPSTGCAS